MTPLEDTIASLGSPLLIRALSVSSSHVATIARWRHGAATVEIGPSDTYQIAMTLVEGRNVRSDTAGYSASRVRGGSISVISPAEATRVSVGGDADVLQIFVKRSFAETMLESRIVGPSMFDLRDDRMQASVLRILVGSARGSADDALLVEQGLVALAERVARHSSRFGDSRFALGPRHRGGLSRASARKVEEMISVALEEASSPSLLDLASAAGLSVTQFLRAFRQDMGVPPHKYLVRRRMERAISLLRSPLVSVAEVADESGFCTVAHFVASFRRVMGVTPAAVREALAR